MYEYILYLGAVLQDKMPEGPEVKIIAVRLNKLLSGKCLRSIKILSGPYSVNTTSVFKKTRDRVSELSATLKSRERAICFGGVHSKGKFIYFNLIHLKREPGPPARIVEIDKIVWGSSLGLKGKWAYGSEKPDNARFEIRFSDKSGSNTLWYVDSMSQGKFNIENPDWLQKKLKTIGPDIFEAASAEFLVKMKTKKAQKIPLFEALMDQSLISGVGNYLRSEILYDFQENHSINPFVLVSSLTDDQLVALFNTAQKTAKNVVRMNGSEQYGSGYEMKIYGQKTAPNGNPIKTHIGKGNRRFYYVPI